ncbi:ATP-binding protein [Candidatus Woesearchaeota archaeon]|nr:ATP-binding protein [Candidatus Woesearchaeota archaeon]
MCGAGFFIYKTKLQKKKRYVSNLNLSLLPKQGARSAFAGLIAEKKVKAFFDIDQLQTHTIIAGSTGGGKTVAAKVLIEEALIKGISVIVFDPTAQWSGMLRRNQDKKMLAIYENYGLKKTDARSFNGNIRTITNPRQIINIKKFMKPGEITIFVVSRLEPKDIDIIVANTVKQVFKADLPENKELKLVILFDEVHRLLPKFGGSGQGFVQVERGAREFRKWGVGLVLISQVLTDFMGEIKANINTEIQMRTRDQGDLDRIKNKYGTFMLQSLLKASTGTGMLQNSSYNNGEPYFISFRPLLHEHARLSDDELANYTKYNDLLDDLEFQIDQLEELKVDVFDMRLELKMALDKVKAGSFNMVEIYLESLLPRIKSEWEKLGMKPKERKIEVISEEELKRDFELAQKEREKAEKKAGK